MPEGKDEKGFKVEDRRTSVKGEDDGAADLGGEKSPDDGPPPEEAAPPVDHIPQVDFSTFIFSLFSSALIQLGDMNDPITGKSEKNLGAAKQTIDIVDIIKEKTRGNLDDEEDKLVTKASTELKWKYLDAVKKEG